MFMNECIGRLNHTLWNLNLKSCFHHFLFLFGRTGSTGLISNCDFPSFAEIINQRQRNCTERCKCNTCNRFIKNEKEKYHLPGNHSLKGHLKV